MTPPLSLVHRLLVEDCAADPSLVPPESELAGFRLDPLLAERLAAALDRHCPLVLPEETKAAARTAATAGRAAELVQDFPYVQLLDLLIERCGIPTQDLSPEADFTQLDIDSLHLVELMVMAEERLDMQLPDHGADLHRNITLREAAALFRAESDDAYAESAAYAEPAAG